MKPFPGVRRSEHRVEVYDVRPITLDHSDGWTKGVQVSAVILGDQDSAKGCTVWWLWNRYEPHTVGETLTVRASWDDTGRGKRVILNPPTKTKGDKKCRKKSK